MYMYDILISVKAMLRGYYVTKTSDNGNKSDISHLKTSRAFDVQIHSRALLAAVVCWLATL